MLLATAKVFLAVHLFLPPQVFSNLVAKLDIIKILELDDPAFVDSVFARNETTTRATSRLLDVKKTEDIVSINKRVVETVFSQEVIGRQIYDVITAS